ncbi:MAG: hypothetical protein EZS28_001742 [Streblomastix strix]|uniref:Uncharacterized protein n=1 Tax=Streblomastix strix TaxID=222440 RepID=A0A5J4X6S3_9EUKA|nr:MAG: hypothetical protein EZS28_001742 [Streblomastix strix]
MRTSSSPPRFMTYGQTQGLKDSPIKGRLESFRNRIEVFGDKIEDSRHSRLKAYEDELQDIKEKLQFLERDSNEKLAAATNARGALNEKLLQSEALRHSTQKDLENDIEQLKGLLHESIAKEEQEGKQVTTFLRSQVQEQLKSTEAEISQILLERDRKMNDDFDSLEEEIPRLNKLIQEERAEEENFLSQVRNQLEDQVDQLKKAIEIEQSTRKAMQQEAERGLNEFTEWATGLLEEEKNDREVTESQLSELWKKTCQKIEEARDF